MDRTVEKPVIAIIGGGFTGAVTALQIAGHTPAASPRIVIFEPRSKLGAGLAYDTRDPSHRINVPAARMSAYPDDLESFARWSEETGAVARDPEAEGLHGNLFLHRQVFGEYVNATLQPFLQRGRIEHKAVSVIAVERAGARWLVVGDDGRGLVADIVVLAVSHPPPSAPKVLFPLRTHPRFVANPTVVGALDPIRADDHVLVVGNGLTAADVVASLTRRGHKGLITSISRRGLRSRGHARSVQDPFGDFVSEPSLTASALLRRVRSAIRQAAQSGFSWHAVVDTLRAQGQDIWAALPLAERCRIIRHLRPYWDAHRFRVAPQVEAVLDEAITAGRLDVCAASVVSASIAGERMRCLLQFRRERAPREIDVDAVVVTTGPSHGGILNSQRWLADLSEKGLLTLCQTGLGIACDRQARALHAAGRPVPGIYIAGPLARGTFGELMGVPQVAAHAELVARQIIGEIEKLAAKRISAA